MPEHSHADQAGVEESDMALMHGITPFIDSNNNYRINDLIHGFTSCMSRHDLLTTQCDYLHVLAIESWPPSISFSAPVHNFDGQARGGAQRKAGDAREDDSNKGADTFISPNN